MGQVIIAPLAFTEKWETALVKPYLMRMSSRATLPDVYSVVTLKLIRWFSLQPSFHLEHRFKAAELFATLLRKLSESAKETNFVRLYLKCIIRTSNAQILNKLIIIILSVVRSSYQMLL